MTITHHPDGSTLMSFAAGAIPEALGAVVAAHVAMCAGCRKELRLLNGLGGAVIASAPAAPLNDPGVVAGQAAAGEIGAGVARTAARHESRGARDGEGMAVLDRVILNDFSGVRWRRLGLGVWHMPLELSDKAKGDLRLIKVAPGTAMPDHGHGGSELTLILAGRYTDEVGTFGAGDIEDIDGDVEHMPVADAKAGCICLIASERPAKFKGFLARIVQPIIGM